MGMYSMLRKPIIGRYCRLVLGELNLELLGHTLSDLHVSGELVLTSPGRATAGKMNSQIVFLELPHILLVTQIRVEQTLRIQAGMLKNGLM